MNHLPPHAVEQEEAGEHSALEWLAFRYLANELTPGEREAFEARLECDEAAQQALSSMVRLTYGMKTVFGREPMVAVVSSRPSSTMSLAVDSTTARPRLVVSGSGDSPRSRGRGVLAVATAVCVAALFAFLVFPKTEGPETVSSEEEGGASVATLNPQARRADRLVALWSESRPAATAAGTTADGAGSLSGREDWDGSFPLEVASSAEGASRSSGATGTPNRETKLPAETAGKLVVTAELTDGSRVDVPDWLVTLVASRSANDDDADNTRMEEN